VMNSGRSLAVVCAAVTTAMVYSVLLSTSLVAGEIRLRVEETSIPFPRVDMGTGLVVDPTGEFLLATTCDGTVAIWKLDDLNAEPEILDGGHWQAWTPVFIPDGSSRMFLWCTRLNDKYPPVLELWDFKNRKLLADRVFENDFGISVEPHGDRVISNRIDMRRGPHGSSIYVGELDLSTLEITKELPLAVGRLHSVNQGELLTLAGGGVRRIDTRTWELGPVLQTSVTANPKRRINNTALSPDRNWMAWSTYPTQPYRWKSERISMRRSPVWGPEIIELWNTKTEESWELCITKGPVYRLQFSPDGRYLVSVGGSSRDEAVTPYGPEYGEIALFDVTTQKLVTRLVLEKHPFLYRCTFLPGSREILALHQNYNRGQPGITRITIEGVLDQE
jgi:WD40 repeat protein